MLTVALLLIIFICPVFLPPKIAVPFLALIGLPFFPFDHRFKRSIVRLMWPLGGILIIGLIQIQDYQLIDVLRDLAYVLMPISLLLFGSWLEGHLRLESRFFNILVGCGVFLSLIHLANVVSLPELLSADAIMIREQAGPGFSLVTISLFLILFRIRFYLNNTLKLKIFYFLSMFPLISSLILSYSRTGWFISISLLLSILGVINKISLRLIFVSSLLCVSIIITNILIMPETEGIKGTFYTKILNSVSEILPSDYISQDDITLNWRGFETHIAMQHYKSGTLLQLIIGQGFGARVDLLSVMTIADANYTSIPVLHNGYIYILVKTGLAGLGLCILFFYKIIKIGSLYSFSKYSSLKFYGRFSVGCFWSLVIATVAIGGLYGQSDTASFVIMIGYLNGRIERYREEGYFHINET